MERSVARFASARLGAALGAAPATGPSPLRLVDMEPPELPGAGWKRIEPRLAGICGSDLATLGGKASRWFEPIVTFPFVPGHEVVATIPQSGERVVLEAVLACAARGIDPPCAACVEGRTGACENIAFGELSAGLQSGYCADVGGGWSESMVAHESQLHAVPDELSDEAAVVVEPVACALHAALAEPSASGGVVAVIGAGTLGLGVTAALHHYVSPQLLITSAKHAHQAELAKDLGADLTTGPDGLGRAVRRATRSFALGGRLSGGADVVYDCVGSPASLKEALGICRPGGAVVLVGMPGPARMDLTPLWQREIRLVGAYAYGVEANGRRSFEMAMELVAAADLGRLVSARYPLGRYEEALAHAASAGRRGGVKIVFEPGAGSRAGGRSKR